MRARSSNHKDFFPFLFVVLTASIHLACNPPSGGISGEENGTIASSEEPPITSDNIDNIHTGESIDPSTTVCDPFSSNQNTHREYGLKGSLYYLSPDQPQYTYTSEYLQQGHKVEGLNLFLSQLYVPTRAFDKGFINQNSQVLQTPNGDTLYEYFALYLESQLILNTYNLAGKYQLAILSDDGSVVEVDTGSGTQILIDNDNVHPTRMKCATEPVELTADSKLPLRIKYFQGPRYHISLILMWRPWPSNPADVNDPLCGHTSNQDFFDSTQEPSTQEWAYNQLLSRGWKPLEADNFLLKDEQNPCWVGYYY